LGGGLTVIHQIIRYKLSQSYRIMLASLRKGNYLGRDDLRNGVINVTFEQERVADL
jgi:hypothetical protein